MPDAHYAVPSYGQVQLRLPELPALTSLQSHVPGITESQSLAPKLQLLYSPEQQEIIRDNGTIISFGGPWSEARSADTPHLLYAIFRKHWLMHGVLPLHAAAVSTPSRQAVLLAGPSGIGKTTLCAALIKQQSWHFLSGNKTLLSLSEQKLRVISGTVTQSILQTDGTRQQIIAGTTDRFPMPVSAIILPYLNDGAQNWRQLSPLSALHTLFPLLLDVMNADVLLANGTALYSGTIDMRLKENLGRHLAVLLQDIPVYHGVGSLEFLCQKIEECT